MPVVQPVFIDPYVITLADYITPTAITETPVVDGSNFRLSHAPFLDWNAYNWDTNTWRGTQPTSMTFNGLSATDLTEWFRDGSPKFSEYRDGFPPEYFVDGQMVYTNIPDTILSGAGFTITYSYLTDGVRIEVKLRSNSTDSSQATPTVDSYLITLSGNKLGRHSSVFTVRTPVEEAGVRDD